MLRPKVLCIDHHTARCASCESLLGALGYDVVTANTATQALGLACFYRDTVDAVVLDYEMPGTSVNELAATIKLFRPALPVVIVSERESVVQDAFRFLDSAMNKRFDTIQLSDLLRVVMKA